MPKGVYPRSDDERARLSEHMRKVRIKSPEHYAKVSAALKGRKPKNYEEFRKKSLEQRRRSGPEISNWKGSDVGYSALHAWLVREFGRPRLCERCGTTTAKRFEWANKSRSYQRDRSDWERLCTSCHRKDGYTKGEYAAWNANRKVQTNTGRTHFKKGIVPWNKHLGQISCKECAAIFTPRTAKQRFCSHRCASNFKIGRPRGG